MTTERANITHGEAQHLVVFSVDSFPLLRPAWITVSFKCDSSELKYDISLCLKNSSSVKVINERNFPKYLGKR